MNFTKLKGNLMLLLTAIIWGTAFVFQSVGMDSVEPFTFNGIRTLLGCVVLLPVIFIKDKRDPTSLTAEEKKKSRKLLLQGGVACGVLLCVASNFQQFGIQYTTAGKSGFITALYVVLVPIFSFIFFKKKIRPLLWVGVGLAVVGLYLLCMAESLSLSKGDLLILICAFLFTLHILVIDHYSPLVDGVKLSCVQFFVAGILSVICMFLFEEPVVANIWQAAPSILFTGILSSGVAYTLQIVGQKYTDPTVASIILCLESVFAVLAGWLILQETLSPREAIGCVLMFTAILLTQLPEKKKN